MVIYVSERTAAALEDGTIAIPEGYSLRRALTEDPEFEQRHRKAGLHRWYRVESQTEEIFPTKAAADLSGLSEYTEFIPACSPDAAALFNDPSFMYQWHLSNSGGLVGGAVAGADINVVPVWESYTAGSREVIVGVVDSGVQSDHPDLAGIVIPPGSGGSRSFLTNNLLTPYSYTPQRHGTHVAGIIAAINNNGTGGCGIAGGSDGSGGVRILDCQAIGSTENESGDVFSAIIWAADHGAVLLNNSWNISYDSEEKVPLTTPGYYSSVINYFIDNAGTDSNGRQTGPMKGGVVFFSAGNKSWQRSQPSMYEKVVSVGALGPAGEASYYTNYGDWVDICAPGGNYSPYGSYNATIYSTVSEGGYAQMQGTSQACPMVCGVAALLVSHFGGEGFTNTDLLNLLLGGTDKEAAHSVNIGPVLDAYESFVFNTRKMEPADDIAISSTKTSATVNWTASLCGDDNYYGYKVVVSEKESELKTGNPFNMPSGTRIRTITKPRAGKSQSAVFYQLDSCTDYYCTAFGYTKSHQFSKNNQIVKFRINGCPSLKRVKASPISLKPGISAEAVIEYSDPDGDDISIEVEPGSAACSWNDDGEGSVTLSIASTGILTGSYKATVKVSDASESAVLEVPYTLLPNQAPLISSDTEMLTAKPGILHLQPADYFTDPDDDPLFYECSAEGDFTSFNYDGSAISLELPERPGIAIVHMSATDTYSSPSLLSIVIRITTGGKIADVYPVRMTDKLQIWGNYEGHCTFRMVSASGKTAYSVPSLSLNKSLPADLDVSGLAPGRYTVILEGPSGKEKLIVVKI